MNKLKASEEFVVGKHNIGWIGSDFVKYFKDVEFEPKAVLGTYQKLPRYMNDAAIESELKPGLCELGDVLAFLDLAPEQCKDGSWNLFYTSSCVVLVAWYGDKWDVHAWDRGGDGWGDDRRVFSPATRSSKSLPSSEPVALEFEITEVKINGKIYRQISQ